MNLRWEQTPADRALLYTDGAKEASAIVEVRKNIPGEEWVVLLRARQIAPFFKPVPLTFPSFEAARQVAETIIREAGDPWWR